MSHTDTRNARSQVWTLRELYAQIDQAYEDTHGEETPDIAALEAFAEEESKDVLELLADAYEQAKDFEAGRARRKEKIDSQLAASARFREWCKVSIREVMLLRDETRVVVGDHDLRCQSGRQRVELDPACSAADLPDDCVIVVPEQRKPNKKAIGDALKAGREIKGARIVRGPEVVVVK